MFGCLEIFRWANIAGKCTMKEDVFSTSLRGAIPRKCKDIRKATSEYDTVYLIESKYIQNWKVIVYMTYDLYSYMFTDTFRTFLTMTSLTVIIFCVNHSCFVSEVPMHCCFSTSTTSIHINWYYFNKMLTKKWITFNVIMGCHRNVHFEMPWVAKRQCHIPHEPSNPAWLKNPRVDSHMVGLLYVILI